MVFIKPFSMPQISSTIFTNGLTQLVVHEALEMIRSSALRLPSLAPKTTILMSEVFAGAESNTFPAPASKCFEALSESKNNPVHSKTTSTFISFQGSSAGFLMAVIRISVPFTNKFPFIVPTSPLNRP
jgi:hypothetical protein